MRPIVGVTSYVEPARWGYWDAPAALVPLTYVRAIDAAGGRAVVVPPAEEGNDALLDALDGLLLSGGADVDPGVYGADRHPETTGMRPDRDRSELELLTGALERRMPVLAVCRGMQLLNVARGGDLIQHLPEVTTADQHRRDPGSFARHEVELAGPLVELLGERTLVASHHHQAPGRIGEGLSVAATATDGTVEALVYTGRVFAVGVLWHPEEGEDRALFEALVEQASRYRKEHR